MADPAERDAFVVGLTALRRCERPVAELTERLLARGFDAAEVDQAITRLIECGELDDERFARLFAEDKRELAGWGSERIAAVLRRRGIEPALIEGVCLADGHQEQVERAAGVLAERGMPLGDDRERARALGLLTRRGYPYEVAYEAIRCHERAA